MVISRMQSSLTFVVHCQVLVMVLLVIIQMVVSLKITHSVQQLEQVK